MNNKLDVILTGTPSDSHMWNLIFMELFLQENGCNVRNLGPCVPTQKILEAIKETSIDLIVISSINGHLFQDAIKIITSFSPLSPAHLPHFVAGGKMGISEESRVFQRKKLIKLGYDDVFIEKNSLISFKQYLHHLTLSKTRIPVKHAI